MIAAERLPCSEPHDFFRPSGWLRRLGLFGLERLVLPLLCALVTGDPVLLIGGHGSAKTELSRRLAAALGLRFHAYDASKALFEDVLGFPSPSALADGRLEYVPGPLGAWDKEFVLLDELSRAEPSMQNKWLEVVRSGSLMGARLPSLRYRFGTMNPPEYLGAGPLDPALAGRFPWVLTVPHITDLAPEEQRGVLEAASVDDAPLLRRLDRKTPEADPSLLAFLDSVRARVGQSEEMTESACRYTLGLTAAARAGRLELDGRRVSMIYRNLQVAWAVHRQAGQDADLRSLFYAVLRGSLPHAAMGQPVEPADVQALHAAAWEAAYDPANLGGINEVLGDGNANRALQRYLDLAPQLDPVDHDRALQRFLGDLRGRRGRAAVEPMVRMLRLSQAVRRRPHDFPVELVSRLMSWTARRTGLETSCGPALARLEGRLGRPLRLDRPRHALAARLALALCASPYDRADEPDFDAAAEVFETLLSILPEPTR